MEEIPKNIHEYGEWMNKHHGVEVSDRMINHYNSVTDKMKQQFEKSDFWRRLGDNLQQYNDEYYLSTNYQLFQEVKLPVVLQKSFESFWDKTYRNNCVENTNWPKAPAGDWLLPNNWFSRIDDIIRTCFVVKYLDGVEILVKKVEELCSECDASRKDFKYRYQAKEEGYYAAHMYMKEEFEIPRIDWDTEKLSTFIEIQVTTQLQEVIRKLLWKYYEQTRSKRPSISEQMWQWRYGSDEFATNYLGHILHYVEGMIVGIRQGRK